MKNLGHDERLVQVHFLFRYCRCSDTSPCEKYTGPCGWYCHCTVQYIYWSIWLILLIRNNWSMWLILYMFRYWSMWLILYMFRYWSMWLIPAPCEPYLPLLCDSSNAVNRADLVSNCKTIRIFHYWLHNFIDSQLVVSSLVWKQRRRETPAALALP